MEPVGRQGPTGRGLWTPLWGGDPDQVMDTPPLSTPNQAPALALCMLRQETHVDPPNTISEQGATPPSPTPKSSQSPRTRRTTRKTGAERDR
ncbi:uncharacterized protein V6R79_016125 [Siganus canaliculatus]